MGWKGVVNLATSGLAIVGGVVGTILTGGNPTGGVLVAAGLLQAFGSLGGNFFSSAFQDKFLNKPDREDILKNGDLIRAVGRAIFTVILAESKDEEYGADAKALREIGKLDESVWEKVATDVQEILLTTEIVGGEQVVLTGEDIADIAPAKLTQYFSAKEEELNDLTALTPNTWKAILLLFAQNQNTAVYIKNLEKLAERLYKDFPKALRKVLVTDFATDGKAYASLQLRIVGEILFYVKETHQSNLEILGKVNNLAERVEMIHGFLKDPNVKQDDQFWQKALDTNTAVLETQKEILSIQKTVLAKVEQQTDLQNYMVELQKDILAEVAKITAAPAKPPVEQFSYKLVPSTTFPQPVNFFTGRRDLLTEIGGTLEQYKTASLFGIHGLGKTAAAIEYAYESLEKYSQIFFILANRNDFFSSMAECAADVGLEFPDQMDDEKKAAGFRKWLESRENFLLILDNVDKVEEVKRFLPTPNRGHILFTSNFPSIKTAGKEVEIRKMELQEAVLLLYRRAIEDSEAKYEDVSPEDRMIIEKIVTEAGFLPLAINISGSYIARKQKTFETYWKLYQKHSAKLLEEYDKDDPNYSRSILTAFSMSYDAVTTPKDDSAEEKFIAAGTANSLKTAVYMLPDNMPEELFRSATALISEEYSKLAGDDYYWDDVVENLLAYGFFERNAENNTFSTHRLIPKTTQTKIGNEENDLLARLAEALDGYFPNFNYEVKKECERFLVHAEYLLNYILKDVTDKESVTKLDTRSTASLFYKVGSYYWFMSNYDLTFTLFDRGCAIAEKILDEDDELLSGLYDHMGGIHHFQGRHAASIPYMEKVVSINEKNAAKYEKTLQEYKAAGKEDTDEYKDYELQAARTQASSLMTSNKLARIYHLAGRIEEADHLIVQVIQDQLKLYGGVGYDVIDSYTVYASILEDLGEYSEAEKMLLGIAQFHRETQEANNPLIYQTYSHLGIIYIKQGRLEEALPILEVAYEGVKNYYGEGNERVTGTRYALDLVREALARR